MRRSLFFCLLLSLFSSVSFANDYWTVNRHPEKVIMGSSVNRSLLPKDLKLYNLNRVALRNELFTIVDGAAKHSTVISIPTSEGKMEQFKVEEYSCFTPALQSLYPEIRSFKGKGITDPSATVSFVISSKEIEAMVHRQGKDDEEIISY